MRKIKKTNNDSLNNNENATMRTKEYDNSYVLTVCTSKSHSEWIMDYICSFHVYPMKDWFVNLNEIDEGKVFIGNDNECRIKGDCLSIVITCKWHD